MPRQYLIADQIILTPCEDDVGPGSGQGGILWLRIETKGMRHAPGAITITMSQAPQLIEALKLVVQDWVAPKR